jgi:hypothetical protein
MEACWGSGGISPRIFDLGTRWRWLVSFTPRPLYPWGKSLLYPLDRRLGGLQSQWWWREKFPAPAGTRTTDHLIRSPELYHWAIPVPNFPFYCIIEMQATAVSCDVKCNFLPTHPLVTLTDFYTHNLYVIFMPCNCYAVDEGSRFRDCPSVRPSETTRVSFAIIWMLIHIRGCTQIFRTGRL